MARSSGVFSADESGALIAEAARAAAEGSLNRFMSLGQAAWSALRLALSRALREGAPQRALLQSCLVKQHQVQMGLPAQIGDYTDFYTSIYHATAVGRLMRPDNPLFPNYKWLPIGYHGRCSSLGVSGQQFRRPWGQVLPQGTTAPVLSPSRRLDYELELAVFIGPGNAPGEAIGIEQAESQVFGMCLLNDWSARDLQGWEAQPLGPFLAKNFATTLSRGSSPWKRWSLIAPRGPGRPRIRSRCPIWIVQRCIRRARSISRWKCCCRPKPCGTTARPRHAFPAATIATPTGRSHRW